MSRARLRASSVSRLAVQDASRVGVQIPRLKKKNSTLQLLFIFRQSCFWSTFGCTSQREETHSRVQCGIIYGVNIRSFPLLSSQPSRLRTWTTARPWARCATLTAPKTSSTNPPSTRTPTCGWSGSWEPRSLASKPCSYRGIRSGALSEIKIQDPLRSSLSERRVRIWEFRAVIHYLTVFLSPQIALLDSPTALSMEQKLHQNEARVNPAFNQQRRQKHSFCLNSPVSYSSSLPSLPFLLPVLSFLSLFSLLSCIFPFSVNFPAFSVLPSLFFS